MTATGFQLHRIAMLRTRQHNRAYPVTVNRVKPPVWQAALRLGGKMNYLSCCLGGR
jgi:hypothetical protein